MTKRRTPRKPYSLTLTLAEIDAIRFVASRGYAERVAEAIGNGLSEHDGDLDSSESDRHVRAALEVTVAISEPEAWAIHEEERTNGGHGFGPVSEALTSKLYALLEQAV
jgi:hypothetical protein